MAEETPKGLEGVVVVELGDYVAMPACPRILGEMGATVYKIETPTGNLHRLDGPGFGMPSLGDNDPAMDMAGMNKNWLSIDMKTEEGKEFADKIIASADIFITSIRDKSLARLGYDYETLHKKYPKLVYGQMRGYGPRGPMRHAKGFDATCYAARGSLLMSIPQADEHFQPGNLPAAFGDLNSSIALGMGLLAALYRAQKTGEGDFVTVNLYHMALWGAQVPVIAGQFDVPFPKDRKAAPCPTNNSYRSKDGVWFLICYGSYNAWYPYVMRCIGLPEYAEDPRYTDCATINANGDVREVIRLMEEAFAQKDWDEWVQIFEENEIPYARCNTIYDTYEDQEAIENDILRPIDYGPELGTHLVTTSPIRMKSVGDPVLRRAKPIGYDTERIMKEFGYTDEDVQHFKEIGAVRCFEGELPDCVEEDSYGPGWEAVPGWESAPRHPEERGTMYSRGEISD
ncbi:MAG: CaiB/BaiF CoA transferase family protein [Eggerthellaceae bacterium]